MRFSIVRKNCTADPLKILSLHKDKFVRIQIDRQTSKKQELNVT